MRTLLQTSKQFITIILLTSCLQGCIFIAGAALGASVFGVVVYDKRSPQETKLDKTITEQLENKLNQVPEIKQQAHIIISSFNQTVLIAGQVPTEAMKQEVFSIAQTIPGVNKLFNQLTIQGKPSTLSKFNDSLLNTEIKTKLMADSRLESSEIQVVTVDSTVYLMGIVSKQQANIAVSVAQHVSGVHKVIKAFEYHDTSTEWG